MIQQFRLKPANLLHQLQQFILYCVCPRHTAGSYALGQSHQAPPRRQGPWRGPGKFVNITRSALGKLRALGVAAQEDKTVQQAVVTILNQIYEQDFRGFSSAGSTRSAGKPRTGGSGRAGR